MHNRRGQKKKKNQRKIDNKQSLSKSSKESILKSLNGAKIDRKQILLLGYMRRIHNKMMKIPMDIINLCLLFYYIPFYSARIQSDEQNKTFILKHCQFYAQIVPLTMHQNENCYQYTLSLNKFPSELNFKRKNNIHQDIQSITLYHELILDNDEIIDVNIATFNGITPRIRTYEVHIHLNDSLRKPLGIRINTKILRIGYRFEDTLKYIDFNPYGNISTKMDINWQIKNIYTTDSIFSTKFVNNYWCLRYRWNKAVGIRLLCLPVGITKIKVKCILNNDDKKIQILRYHYRKENECIFNLENIDKNILIFNINVEIIEIYDTFGIINKKKWIQYGFVKNKTRTKIVNLVS